MTTTLQPVTRAERTRVVAAFGGVLASVVGGIGVFCLGLAGLVWSKGQWWWGSSVDD